MTLPLPLVEYGTDLSPIFFKSLFPPDGRISRAQALFYLRKLGEMTPEGRRNALRTLPRPALRALYQEWWWGVHEGQAEPDTDWRIWAMVAGRGFGKTRAGAEWVWARAREDATARIALVGATIDEVVRVMVRGESGLLAIARPHELPRWIPTLGLVRFPSGAEAYAFSAERPDKLRGPQHHFAWCDELAKWPNADDTWNNLMLGLRLGETPRTIVTTTPKPIPLLRRILALPRTHKTEGRTDQNPHLPEDFIEAMRDMFAGTRLARQELEGMILEQFEGALWTRELIEKARHPSPTWGEGRLAEGERGEGTDLPKTDFTRIVVGVDPPASTGGNSCGIVVCGMDEAGDAWVLADLTQAGLTPEGWASRVVAAAHEYGTLYTGVPAKVVAEKNQGGNMVGSMLRGVDSNLPLRLVSATKNKPGRAEPIALRFETGRVKLAGHFPDLEDQLCALTWEGYHLPGSPDRLDAMVWALTELFEKKAPNPGVRSL
ncbi:MAG: ATP-binding protein [Alphaproteobacteria bacterium]|nr:MAG: ATP-binding protein [Alphaproteobacteria bacterium]